MNVWKEVLASRNRQSFFFMIRIICWKTSALGLTCIRLSHGKKQQTRASLFLKMSQKFIRQNPKYISQVVRKLVVIWKPKSTIIWLFFAQLISWHRVSTAIHNHPQTAQLQVLNEWLHVGALLFYANFNDIES